MVLTGSRLLSNSSVVQVLALLSRFALAHLISDAFQTYLFYLTLSIGLREILCLGLCGQFELGMKSCQDLLENDRCPFYVGLNGMFS